MKMQVHNHDYDPTCAEYLVDGGLQGACLTRPTPDLAKWLRSFSLFDETVTVDGVVYDAARIRALVLERHQLATEINDLRARLKGAHTHLVQRTRALTRVISRERRQSAVVIGDTAYFPGRVREILEQYHRKGTA